MLLWGLRQRGSYQPEPGWAGFAVRVFGASCLMGSLMAGLAEHIDWLALGRHEALRAGAMALALAASAALYFGVLALLGIRLRSFMRKA
jgi:putative peptidoglycan lipid II flippase